RHRSRAATEPHAPRAGPPPHPTARTQPSPSPTHVGMDRRAQQPGHHLLPEPHARGDGPLLGGHAPLPKNRAPRTWGWTVLIVGAGTSGLPSPTHVGMDLI